MCKVDQIKLDQHLKITRSYAFNGDIEGTFQGVCAIRTLRREHTIVNRLFPGNVEKTFLAILTRKKREQHNERERRLNKSRKKRRKSGVFYRDDHAR